MSEPTKLYRLILLRHAQAEAHSVAGDHARALALTGRRQAKTVGEYLSHEAKLRVDVALCSTALRTRQTWSLVQSQLPYQIQTVESERLYEARPGEVLSHLNSLPDAAHTVIVIGHEPTMSATARILTDPTVSPDLPEEITWGIATATMCVLESTSAWSQWQPRSARFVSMWRPQD